ncbi:MAG TPA: TlpA disulfide reductase family protein [Porticoccaceae bacterium]|nr:TlpA disulfide reductase family protein [Porticoccaceae bacterium]
MTTSFIRPLPSLARLARGALAVLLVAILAGCGQEEGDKPLTLDTLRGYTVFVNYWAEWCAPCREEVPELNDFQKRHRDTVRVVGVNFDRLEGKVLAGQVASLGIEFPSLAVDPREALGVPVPVGLPETFVIDPGGKLVSILRGPQTLEQLEEALALATGAQQP